MYDQYGEEGLKQQGQGGGGGFQDFGGNFEDIFSSFFGKKGGKGGGQRGGGGGGFQQEFHFNFGGGGGFEDFGDPFGQGGGESKQKQKQQKEDVFDSSDVYEIDMGSLSRFLRRQEVWIIFFYKKDQDSMQYKNTWKELVTRSRLSNSLGGEVLRHLPGGGSQLRRRGRAVPGGVLRL